MTRATGQLCLAIVGVLLAGSVADGQAKPGPQQTGDLTAVLRMIGAWFFPSNAGNTGGAEPAQARTKSEDAVPAVKPPVPSVAPPAPATALDPAAAQKNIQDFLSQNCAACHGPDSVGLQFNVTDFRSLARNGYLVPGQPDSSLILKRVGDRRRPMPPPQRRPLAGHNSSELVSWVKDLQPPPPQGIVDTLKALGHTRLVEAGEKAGLTEVLKAGGPYTILAPTNKAMEGMKLSADDLWVRLLDYAILGKYTSGELETSPPKTSVGGLVLKVERKAGQLFIGGAKVLQADVVCENAVIHVIDRLLGPPVGPPSPTSMVLIRGGKFLMGSPPDAAITNRDEQPQVEVQLSSFLLGATEVTRAQYLKMMNEDPSYDRQKPEIFPADQPVQHVPWTSAAEFCNRLSRAEGLRPYYDLRDVHVVPDTAGNGYRLPTEAEWEIASRGGSVGDYCFGNDPQQLKLYAVFREDQGPSNAPQRVGGKLPNAWGLYDMHGNVQEWCQDWYGPYRPGPLVDPTGPPTGTQKVYRGGAYWRLAKDCRSAARKSAPENFRHAGIGFRVARTLKGAQGDTPPIPPGGDRKQP